MHLSPTVPSRRNTKARCDREILRALELLPSGVSTLGYISSAGLYILLATAKQLQVSGGELRVCSPSDFVQEVFDIAGFDSIVSVSTNEAAALKGF